MRPKFLLDEHVPPRLIDAVLATEPRVEFRSIGSGHTPPCGTPDREVLLWAIREEFVTISFDMKTMINDFYTLMGQGRRPAGLVIIPDPDELAVSELVDDLLLIWEGHTADEMIERIEYLPL